MEKRLSDILARLPIPGLKESNDRHTIAEVLSEQLGIPIQPKQIVFKDSILIVSSPPVVKSALHLKRKDILSLLEKKGISIQTIK
ncbi:MAG: hypothetical protein V4480_01645 [Patescibacteria group bacterium]